MDTKNISLRLATSDDESMIVALDYRLDSKEHTKLNRKKKIAKAISNDECFMVCANGKEVGFLIFDYRFFDQGWIELLVIDENYRGKGFAVKVLDLVCQQCVVNKVFTSTNSSNTRMQAALAKANFTFAGEITGLDEGDPEWFYFKERISK